MPIIKAITKLIGSNDVPIHIRHELAQKFMLMMKNKVFTRFFMHENKDAFDQLSCLYNVIQENSSKRQNADTSADPAEYDCENQNNNSDQEDL